MKKIWKIPTILGVFFILTGLAVGIFLVGRQATWLLKAEADIVPREVKITNVTDRGFTISWVTDTPIIGYLNWGTDANLTQTALDDRDTNGKSQEYTTHYFSFKNLQPETTYFFKISSGGKIFENNGQPFDLTTPATITSPPPTSDIASGKIINEDGTPAAGAIVYLSLAGATPQSALTKPSGNWLIPLNLAYSLNLESYASYNLNSASEEIYAQGVSGQNSLVVTNTGQDNPVPDVTLGKNYDFLQPVETAPPASQPPASATTPPATSRFTFEELPAITIQAPELEIINPAEGETVYTQQPNFIGSAPPGETITITVESAPQTGTVLADANGNWEWSPPAELEPGQHTVTINYTDLDGETHAESRRFVVLAADNSLPAIEATPSGRTTLTPTPTPRTTSTPAPAATASAQPLPESGNLTPGVIISIMGVVFILMGFFSWKFFITKPAHE